MPAPTPETLLDRPVILLGRGFSGTRVLSLLAQSCGLFIGSQVNDSRDSLEMTRPIYRGIRQRAEGSGRAIQLRIAARIREAAGSLWEGGGRPPLWGFKLPESILLLPEMRIAFPAARFAFIKRDPAASVLGRVHPTADPAVPFGAASIVLASRWFGLDPEAVLADSRFWRLAVTTAHQLSLALAFREGIESRDWLELSLERTVVQPREALAAMAGFLDRPLPGGDPTAELDPARAFSPHTQPPAEEVERIDRLLAPIRARLGYGV